MSIPNSIRSGSSKPTDGNSALRAGTESQEVDSWSSYFDGVEPSNADLTAIEFFEPLIDAEVAAVDAECQLLAAIERFVQASRNVLVLRQEFPAVWS